METRFENNPSMEVIFSTEHPDDLSFSQPQIMVTKRSKPKVQRPFSETRQKIV